MYNCNQLHLQRNLPNTADTNISWDVFTESFPGAPCSPEPCGAVVLRGLTTLSPPSIFGALWINCALAPSELCLASLDRDGQETAVPLRGWRRLIKCKRLDSRVQTSDLSDLSRRPVSSACLQTSFFSFFLYYLVSLPDACAFLFFFFCLMAVMGWDGCNRSLRLSEHMWEAND